MTPRRPAPWSRLDNAAKIFPSTSTRADTKVFRFCCELTGDVRPELLQEALTRTMESFPFYRSILRKGMFWYYFEQSALEPVVRQEYRSPCAPLYDPNRRSLLFEVTYYRARINLEVYHALSDGTGALEFLRALVTHYLALCHPDEVGAPPALDYDASSSEKMDDSFARYYSGPSKGPLKKTPRAYRLSGEREPEYRLHVVEGVVSVRAVLARAHELGATLTEYLSAVLMRAIYKGMPVRARRLPVVLTVPVNLRKYFPSASARNFFSVVNIGYRFDPGRDGFEDVLASVRGSFREELTAEKLGKRLDELSAVEHNRFVSVLPLGVKDIGLSIANRMSESGITAALSNIGRVSMPPQVAPFIRQFEVFCATRRIQLCLCSFGDRLTLSFTSPFVSADVERRFFRALSEQGMEIEIVTNLPGAAWEGGGS